MFRKFYKILVIFSAIEFIIGIILIVIFPEMQTLCLIVTLAGVSFVLLIGIVERIVRLIYFLRHPKIATQQARDVINSAGKHIKSNFSLATSKEKFMIISVLGSFILIIILMAVAVFLVAFPETQTAGFIMMGISGGGMIIWLISMIIISKKN